MTQQNNTNQKTYKVGEPFRDGTCVHILWGEKGCLTMDKKEIEMKWTEDGLMYYEENGQKFYPIYA